MAYTNPLSWSVGDYFDIFDINPSAGYVTQPFGDPYAYVHLRNGTILVVDVNGTVIETRDP